MARQMCKDTNTNADLVSVHDQAEDDEIADHQVWRSLSRVPKLTNIYSRLRARSLSWVWPTRRVHGSGSTTHLSTSPTGQTANPVGIDLAKCKKYWKKIPGETNFTCAGINNKGQWLPKVSFFDFDVLMKVTSVWRYDCERAILKT